MVPPTMDGPSHYNYLIRITPHKQTERPIPQVVLGSIKVAWRLPLTNGEVMYVYLYRVRVWCQCKGTGKEPLQTHVDSLVEVPC